MTRRHHRLAAYTLSALLALTAAACGGGDDDDPPAATGATPAPTTTTPTTLSPEAEIEAAYRGFLELVDANAATPDPDDERLDEVLVDPLLTDVRTSLAERKASNQYYEVGDESRNEVLSITDNQDGTATMLVCSVSSDRLIDRDTGEQIAGGTSTFHDEVSLRVVNSRWMLSDYTTLDSWDGVRSCA